MTSSDCRELEVECAIGQLGKSRRDTKDSTEVIRKWCESQSHLPEVPCDELIESFLVANRFLVERTKEKLDMYYTIRSLLPECFENKNPKLPNMKEIVKVVYYCPLPKMTRELYRVNIVKITGEPESFDAYDCFGHQLNINEIRLQEEIVLGDILIIDFADIKVGHVMKFTPIHMRKASIILEKVFSNRIKGIHMINAPVYVEPVINLLRSFLKQKLLNRIHVHSSPKLLLNHISSEILPKDYGGSERPLKELNGKVFMRTIEDLK
ncbi:unnamed protein product [Acanthoscelides obtectus]|uniref:CRAL-TRIO domain-containing protein n=1 Tax=Acanthoscelides obtectus TaxID=200917 RepID=A0A9P0Q479_ACAOB|nr:unnamed protein product [Acanthoscelides obtectus]CAK1676936.1 Alpha-tocopherol transfer protein [Acanthoscelides obtectus]